MARSWRSSNNPVVGNAAERESVDLHVLEVARAGALTLAALQSIGGPPRVGMRLLAGSDGWEVRGIGFVPAEAAEAGRWALSLAPVGHDRALPVGAHLVAA